MINMDNVDLLIEKQSKPEKKRRHFSLINAAKEDFIEIKSDVPIEDLLSLVDKSV